MRPKCVRLAVIVGCVCFAVQAAATTYDWSNGVGGTFANVANWSPAGVPGSVDTARLSLASTYTISFSNLATVNALTQTEGDVTLDLNSNTLRANSTSANTLGAAGTTTTLHVTDGTFRPGNLILSNVASATSNLILDTSSSTILGTGQLQIGASGLGNLTVQNGASLASSSGAVIGLNTGSVGNATVTGFDSSWLINTSALRIGSVGSGTLNITNGGDVAAAALEIGEFLNSSGTMSLSGVDATFFTPGTANIGGTSASQTAAAATLSIDTGATVTFDGATNLRTRSVVNLTGGTLNLNTVNVTSGAKFNWSAGTVNFATGAAVTNNLLDFLLAGTHTLGANRTLSATAGTITLGSTLVLSGGKIAAPNIDLNANIDLTGFSTIAASNAMTIQAGKTIQLGNFSTISATTSVTNNGGTLVLNGPFANVSGPFTNTGGYITGTGRFLGGLNNGASGTIRALFGDHIIIDQAGVTNAGTIDLADGTIEYTQSLSNQATGFITGRGVFRGSTATPGGTGLNNVGTLAFSAGTTDIFGDVNNSTTGKIIAAGASVVTFYDDVVHNGVEIRTNAGSRSVFFGSVTGAGPFTGTGDVEFNGDLRPGNSPANVLFAGNVTIGPTAGLDIELAGPTKGAGYDSLTIAGVASLGGSLDVTLLNGFVPSVGQTFEIVRATGGINGMFDAKNLPALSGGLHLDLVYGQSAVTLLVGGIDGDYNLDGKVDAADFAIFRKSQGLTGLTLAADGNHNGLIDSGDYDVWRAHFGQSAALGSAIGISATVPEPSAMVLVAVAITLLRFRKR